MKVFQFNEIFEAYEHARLGVRVVKVEHSGTHKQHIDLCGKRWNGRERWQRVRPTDD